MFSLSPPTRDRSATTLHMVRDRLLAMPGAPLKPESPLFGSLQTAVTSTVPAGTVRNWCMQPIVPAEHAGFVSFVRQFSFSMMLSRFTVDFNIAFKCRMVLTVESKRHCSLCTIGVACIANMV